MRNRYHNLVCFSLASTLALGCGGQDVVTEAPEDAEPRVPQGMSMQGERLQASSLGGTWAVLPTGAVDASGVAYDLVKVQKGELIAFRGISTFKRAQLIGSKLIATQNPAAMTPDYQLTINAVMNHRPLDVGSVEWEFDLSYISLAPGAPGPQALCSDPLNRRALPVAGFWLPNGAHSSGAPNQFSFACRGGVILKCIDWGYKPWQTILGEQMGPYHQTCTRLARADYCATGTSYTMDRTPIDYYDKLNINVRTMISGMPAFPVEAVWKAEVSPTRPTLLCLGKKRWDTIPFGGACPLQLPDPRFDRDALFCEDRTFAQWQAMGGVLGNDSLYIDVGLFRWQRPGTGEQFTSTQYIYRGPAEPSPTGPPAGYNFVAFEGALFRDDVSLLGMTPPGGVIPLYTYFSPSRNDRLTTSHEDPNTLPHLAGDGKPLDYDVATRVQEGYLFAPSSTIPHPRAVRLTSWYSPSRKEHTTARAKPTVPVGQPDDYTPVRDEGFVLYKN